MVILILYALKNYVYEVSSRRQSRCHYFSDHWCSVIIDSCDLEFYGAYPRLCFYSCDLKFLDLNHGPRSWCLLHIDLVIANHILRGFSRPVIANHFLVISVISSSQIMWTVCAGSFVAHVPICCQIRGALRVNQAWRLVAVLPNSRLKKLDKYLCYYNWWKPKCFYKME